jgi:RNA polymerase sigma factor (sigma-70 family)
MVEFDRRTWFAQQILVHEAQLRGYLRRFLKPASDVADGVQETYARLLGLTDSELRGIRLPHAFLFAAARNVALEWTRRQRLQRPIFCDRMAETGATSVLDETPSAYEELSAREELALLARAIDSLPARCREVLVLRKLYGLSQKEIAARLGISENTVEKHAANGVRLCANYVYARGDADTRAAHGIGQPVVDMASIAKPRAPSECVDRPAGRARIAGTVGRIRALAGVQLET